jgi:small subunit ribosomal protein S3
MSHIVHPYAHRLGIIKDWKSRWFGVKLAYRTALKCDIIIREFLKEKLRTSFVSGVEIERSAKVLKVIIETSRPGMIIGRNGEGATKLKADLTKELARRKISVSQEIRIDIREVRSPESNAAIVGQMIAEALEKRMPFRRIMKQTLEKVMANRDVKGIKLELSGRLGGSEIARTEKMKKGRIPLQTLRADIDYNHTEARMTYGNIGIKTWIYRGEIFKKPQAK